jgi:flagellar motility protein MotE (MotC chaperone)
MAENKKNKKEKPKKKLGKSIFALFILGLVLAFSILTIGYISFEFSRISSFNLNLKDGWRSYLGYITHHIPILKNHVEYEILEVGDPFFVQNEIINYRIRSIQERNEDLIKTRDELIVISQQISDETTQLNQERENIKLLREDYEKTIRDYNDYNSRVNILASWISEATAAQMVNALARNEVSIELIVDSLIILPADTAADILQTLAGVDPQKAAGIIALIGQKRGE